MPFSRLFPLVSCLVILTGCTGLTRPATIPNSQSDDEIQTKSDDDTLDGRSSSGLCIHTETDTYDAVRIVQITNDTLTVIPYPFWNVESHQIHLDDIISIVVPKEGDNKLKGCTGGFSVGFTVIGIIGLLTSEYNEDYAMSLMLGGLGGVVLGGVGFCLGGIGDIRHRGYYDFRQTSKPKKIQLLNNIVKHHQQKITTGR